MQEVGRHGASSRGPLYGNEVTGAETSQQLNDEECAVEIYVTHQETARVSRHRALDSEIVNCRQTPVKIMKPGNIISDIVNFQCDLRPFGWRIIT